MLIYLETERLILRELTPDDLDHLVALDADPAVMRNINGGIPTPREVIAGERLPRIFRAYERADGYGLWAAIERSTGDFLGWFHLLRSDTGHPGDAELGYRLRRSAWGKGYATEGSRALIRKGFTELGVQRVTACTDEVHLASRRVMEKAGMTLARTFLAPWPELPGGPELEAVEYAITKDAWERQGKGSGGSIGPEPAG